MSCNNRNLKLDNESLKTLTTIRTRITNKTTISALVIGTTLSKIFSTRYAIKDLIGVNFNIYQGEWSQLAEAAQLLPKILNAADIKRIDFEIVRHMSSNDFEQKRFWECTRKAFNH